MKTKVRGKKRAQIRTKNTRTWKIHTKDSPFWKRLEIRMEGSVGAFLGEMNLEMKYQKTAILIIPVIVCPIPPCCCCCPCLCCPTSPPPVPPPPPPPGPVGGGIFSFLSYSGGCRLASLLKLERVKSERWVDGFEGRKVKEESFFIFI